ncbi:hypothetical protein RFI_33626, partial [Reticulomyxa filosa]
IKKKKKKGGFSNEILKRWTNCEKYILIDPWIYQSNWSDWANVNQRSQDHNFESTKTLLKPFASRFPVPVELIFYREFSKDAAPLIADESVDFIYLDARHDYSSIVEDLHLYWPKLKPNGIFSGHDFTNAHEIPEKWKQDWCLQPDGSKCVRDKAVRAAVEEFAREVGRQVV